MRTASDAIGGVKMLKHLQLSSVNPESSEGFGLHVKSNWLKSCSTSKGFDGSLVRVADRLFAHGETEALLEAAY